MKTYCKECPHIIRNRNNDIIVDFAKRMKKSHNCHMTKKGEKDLWNVKEGSKCECYGAKLMRNEF